jgi:hypothetical protein
MFLGMTIKTKDSEINDNKLPLNLLTFNWHESFKNGTLIVITHHRSAKHRHSQYELLLSLTPHHLTLHLLIDYRPLIQSVMEVSFPRGKAARV